MSICQQCGGDVVWTKIDGRWRCFNAGTQTDHWDTCSRRRWQQTVATGERFVSAMNSGYARSVHGTKFDRISSGVMRGRDYHPIEHTPTCEAAPWEPCECGGPLA